MTELPGVENTFNEELSRAIHGLRCADTELRAAKERVDACKDLVVIEMKKNGKDFMSVQLDGEFWEVEVRRAEEKLRFARLKK